MASPVPLRRGQACQAAIGIAEAFANGGAAGDRRHRFAHRVVIRLRVAEHRHCGFGERRDRGQRVDDLMAEDLDELAQRRRLRRLQLGADVDQRADLCDVTGQGQRADGQRKRVGRRSSPSRSGRHGAGDRLDQGGPRFGDPVVAGEQATRGGVDRIQRPGAIGDERRGRQIEIGDEPLALLRSGAGGGGGGGSGGSGMVCAATMAVTPVQAATSSATVAVA